MISENNMKKYKEIRDMKDIENKKKIYSVEAPIASKFKQ